MTPAERLQGFIERGALVRHAWGDGHERACLLAAMAPACAEYETAEKCPANVMPQWLAQLTPEMDDHGTEDAWPAMVRRYAAVAARWHVLDDDAWERVRLRCLHAIVSEARSHVGVEEVAVIDGVLSWLDAGAPESERERAQAAAWSSWAAIAAAEAEAEESEVWDRMTDVILGETEAACDAAEGKSNG